MKKMQAFILLIILTLPGLSSWSLKKPKTGQILYSWIDKPRIRRKPGLKGQSIGSLREGEAVVFLGKISRIKKSVEIRARHFHTPFYYIKRKNGLKGWVYAGALQKEKLLSRKTKQNLMKKYKRLKRKILRMVRRIKIKNKRKKFSIIKNIQYEITDYGQMIYYKDLGHTTVGNRSHINYYSKGILIESKDDQYSTFFLNNFSPTKSGLKPKLTKRKVKRILGRPIIVNRNVLIYATKHPDYGSTDLSTYLCFKNNRLIGIYISTVLGD